MPLKICRILFLISLQCLLLPFSSAKAEVSKPGFVIHFDFIKNASEGRELVDVAQRAGAKVINLVPPAHVWEDPGSLAALNAIVKDIAAHHLSFVFARIDAAYLPDRRGKRTYYLYDRILTDPGRLPNGKPPSECFLTTVGKDDYAAWMEDETRYYATHYGRLPNLLGINLGPFSEPFSSERGGFLEFMEDSQRYEIVQYTHFAALWWRGWLQKHFGGISALNNEYHTEFISFDSVPTPLNETDHRFGRADLAYFDFAKSLNDWFVERYERCRDIWHKVSGRADVPFILQFSGCMAEKFIMGRPAFAAFDLPGWIAMADAVGLSAYTNNGYPDMGHATLKATVNLLATARDMQKPVFVLESGNEAPNVTLDPVQAAFWSSVAASLSPRTYIYEFFKNKFNETYAHNPGKVVAADGHIRPRALAAVRHLFKNIESQSCTPETPMLYVRFNSASCRGNALSGVRYEALLDLSSSVPIRWIPERCEIPLHPGVPILNPDGALSPQDGNLADLLTHIPAADSDARARWRQEVMARLSHDKSM